MTPEERAATVTVIADGYACACLGRYRCGTHEEIVGVIRAAIAEEREACATIIDNWPDDGLIPATMRAIYDELAATIRSRP